MALEIEGWVEVDAALFNPGVLEDALRRFLTAGDPAVIFHRNPAALLGKVTNISGRGDRVEMKATLDPPTPGTVEADAFNKVKSGTIKGLAIEGVFAPNHATVSAFSVAPLTPVLGTGWITSVKESP